MFVKRICCIGAGYVGGPTMAYIAYKCPEIKVTVVDKDTEKINSWNSSNIPVYEPGLSKIIKKNINKNLFFSTEIENAIRESEIIFIAVNTPTKKSLDGMGMTADLSNIEESCHLISKFSNSKKIIVEKSTVPVRTAEKIKEILSSSSNKFEFEVLSNPEFLAESCAIENLSNPDRVLIGGNNTSAGKYAIKSLTEIYTKWVPINKIITTSVWSSELSKLVSNAFLAQRISSINSVSAICEATDARISEVSLSVGSDKRIGKKYLEPSLGFGGSCFKKDILNLVYLCEHYGLHEVARYWKSILDINEYQKLRFSKIIVNKFNKLKISKVITLLGWAFKKETNDSRESASIDICDFLISNDFTIHIYDPKVKSEQIRNDLINHFKKNISNSNKINNRLNKIKIYNSVEKSLLNSHAIAILTEWEEFQKLNFEDIFKKMLTPSLVFDGRNILSEMNLKKIGFDCYFLGNG